jgi:hypothetical protein
VYSEKSRLMIPKPIASLISSLQSLKERGELSSGTRLGIECLPFQDIFFAEVDLAYESEYFHA